MKKTTKNRLFLSVVSLLLCFTMLLGTTYAWFTDSVTSGANIISSGNLDIELYHESNTTGSAGERVTASTPLFTDVDSENWEPGAMAWEKFTIKNEGSLALKYAFALNVADATEIDGISFAKMLKFAIVDDTFVYTRENVQALPADAWLDLEAFASASSTNKLLPDTADTFGIVIWWQPSAEDNLFNMNNGQTAGSVSVTVGVILSATQATNESDSFGDGYDDNAAAEFFPGFQGGSAGIPVTLDDLGLTASDASVSGGDVSAIIPAGVKPADGVKSLALSVTLMDESDSNIQLNESEKMNSLDVHIEGVAEDNTTPMLITLKHYLTTGINTGALRIYHVEDGVTVAMTQVATPENHNEFSYDPLTGDVTLALASFSEVAVVADTNNPWDGTTESTYTGSGTEADPYLIANANQLAYFRTQVDNGNSFEGKFVKLNNNIYLSGKLFDPIGWGYVEPKWNRDGVDGMVFQGTFDGGEYDENGKLVGRYTIFDLYQNGWDLEVNGADYTYTNCGFGLFAAASGAIFKNLTISGANVVAECVEMGVLVGLSQNDCTYDNIKIIDSKIANYQRPAGGLIGEVSGDGTTTITNVTIGSDVVVGSLWGDFDAPCGGVIGAYWDDADKNPQIIMTAVKVGARLDVYNDITSAYQWHAYRRAGMLIGNTDMSDPNNAHKAYAPFLKCSDVEVYYGDWVNYTYCSFANHNSRYPWVRTQAGENCTAFSNPRWGVPNDADGNRVTDMNHVHAEGDECNVLRQFSQLYGGGQGVYGQDKHDGVTTPAYYSITYVNDYKVLDIEYVTDNKKDVYVGSDQAQKLVIEWATKNIGKEGEAFNFGGWMNAGSTVVTKIDAGNTKNIVLYPYFNNPYIARFVDQQGNVVAYCFFHNGTGGLDELEATKEAAEAALPGPGELFELAYWEVNANGSKVQYSKDNFEKYTYDVTIYPVYRYTGNLKLTPVDEDSDGTIDYYKVEAVDKLDETTIIPGYVNGVPVKEVVKLYKNDNNFDYGSSVQTIIIQEGVEVLDANSLSHTKNLDIVELPSTITSLGKNTFSRNNTFGSWFGAGDTKQITIKYNGTKDDWDKLVANSHEDWANGLEKGTVIICTNGYYTATKAGTTLSNHTWTWTSYQ